MSWGGCRVSTAQSGFPRDVDIQAIADHACGRWETGWPGWNSQAFGGDDDGFTGLDMPRQRFGMPAQFLRRRISIWPIRSRWGDVLRRKIRARWPMLTEVQGSDWFPAPWLMMA